MKRALVISVIILLVLSLSGCYTRTVLHTFTGETVEGSPITYDFDEKGERKLKSLMEDCEKLLSKGKYYFIFEKKYKKVNQYTDDIWDAQRKEELKFYIYGKEENKDKANHYSALYYEVLQWIDDIRYQVADSLFKSKFYEGMTDAEIEAYLNSNYPEEFYQCKQEMEEIKREYSLLDYSDSNHLNDADELYVRFVKAANTVANYYGYDNYMEYAYKSVYRRSYQPPETDQFFHYVVKYVIPAYKAAKERYKNLRAALTQEEKAAVDAVFFGDGFTDDFDKFAAYAYAIGGNMKSAYNNLWKEGGKFYVSYEEKSFSSAFTDTFPSGGQPYVFFGNGFHDIMTIVHEFGHYYAKYAGNSVSDYDFKETQSQANELLYVLFLKNNGYYADNVIQTIEAFRLMRAYHLIIVSTLFNALEKKVYYDDDLNIKETVGYVDEIMAISEDLTLSEFDVNYYWSTLGALQPAYYISYGVSLTGALNVYHIAVADFEAGATAYRKIINYNRDFVTLSEVYAGAGLKDPMEEETFIYIFGG